MKTTFSGWRYLWKSPDIRRKLLITLGLLAIFRLAANVPAPGVDAEALRAFTQSASSQGSFLGFLDLLSGGTVSRFLYPCDGCLPLYYRSDYLAIAYADHSGASTAHGG